MLQLEKVQYFSLVLLIPRTVARARFTYRLKPRALRFKGGFQQTVVRIESMASV